MGAVVLVTGVAGTGKSTLKASFSQRGYQTIDIDNGFASWQHNDSRKRVAAPVQQPATRYDKHDWYIETIIQQSLSGVPS